jgi:hypothetical protein
MTMKSFADPHATEVLNPVQQVTEKLNAVPQVTEKFAAVSPVTEKLNPVVAAIPAQRQDSRPAPSPASAHISAPAPADPQRPRWEHLPTERHPRQASPEPAGRHPERGPEQTPQQRLRLAQERTRKAAPKQRVATDPPRWQRTAVAAPQQGALAAAGLAACDYLIRTVSILGLLAVVGMVTAGTAQTPERAPGTTVATAPAHQGSFSSNHHQR